MIVILSRNERHATRIVLITGGMGAIGRIMAHAFLRHGAKVAINDVNDIKNAGKEVLFDQKIKYFQADITDEQEVIRLFDNVTEEFGVPNVVCCHAGIVEVFAYHDYPLASFNKVMDVNLKGSFIVSREAARRLQGKCRENNLGRIIFTSSWVQDVPWPSISAYSASKSAINMLMRSLAREIADQHIRVNSIAPGIVAVGMAKHQWDTEEDYRTRAEKAIPLGFMQPPETVADAMIFLASDASAYITGSTLLVDGGCSLYPMD